jgi:hypothetical protein
MQDFCAAGDFSVSDTGTTSPAAKSPSIVKAALLLALVMAIIYAAVAAIRARKTPESIAMESLIAFTLEHGKPTWVPPSALEYFGLPGEPSRFLEIKAVSETGRRRAIQVRPRENSSAVDVFFVELLPNESKGYFYLASMRGTLIKAAYIDEAPEAVPKAQERFAEEIKFWRHWQREKLKRETI